MSVFSNATYKSHEGPGPHHPQPADSYVEKEDNLEPLKQGGDYHSVPNTYEDVDRYMPIAKPGPQSESEYEIPLTVLPSRPQAHSATPDREDGPKEIPLVVIPPRPQGHDVTPDRDVSPAPVRTGVLLPLPADQPDHPARTNMNIKRFVVRLAVLAVIVGAAIGVGIGVGIGVYTTGNGDTNECVSTPCLNGGTCVDRVNGYTCLCHPRYSGHDCQTENTGCDSQPCHGRSVCNTRGQEHACQCLPGYSGPSCQTDANECESGPCVNGGTCEDRVNGYMCLCRPGYGGANCLSSQVAFSAHYTNTRSLAASWRRVKYEQTLTDLGGAYHNSTFYSLSSGLYYVAMTAETYQTKTVSYRLVGAPQSLGLSTTSTNLTVRTLGRDCTLQIPSATEISTQSRGMLYTGSSTSWSMFSVTAAFHPLVAFTVTRTTPTTELGKVTYPESLVNTGDGYRPADSHFVAPYTGTFYFTVSAEVAAGQKARLHIVKNDVGEVELLHTDTTRIGTDMISSAAILKLSRGDRVHVELLEGSLSSGPEFRQTSFSGFLYSPQHGQAIAWSVWRTDSWTANGTNDEPDILEPVPYDTIIVNDRGVYNISHHVVTVPVSGVYCVHLVGGALARRKFYMEVRYGQFLSRAARIYHRDTSRNGETTVSQSVLLTLEAGDQVWVWAWGGASDGLFSNPGLVTGFSGFLVHPT